MRKADEILDTIRRRKLEYFGHVMRNQKYHLLYLIIQDKLIGRRGLGRRRTSWLKNLSSTMVWAQYHISLEQ